MYVNDHCLLITHIAHWLGIECCTWLGLFLLKEPRTKGSCNAIRFGLWFFFCLASREIAANLTVESWPN